MAPQHSDGPPPVTADEFVKVASTFARVAEQYAAHLTDEFRRNIIMDISRSASRAALWELAEVQRLKSLDQVE